MLKARYILFPSSDVARLKVYRVGIATFRIAIEAYRIAIKASRISVGVCVLALPLLAVRQGGYRSGACPFRNFPLPLWRNWPW